MLKPFAPARASCFCGNVAMTLTQDAIHKRRTMWEKLRSEVAAELSPSQLNCFNSTMPDPEDESVSKRTYERQCEMWRKLLRHKEQVCYIEDGLLVFK